MSIRFDILNELHTAFDTLRVSDDYDIQVTKVHRMARSQADQLKWPRPAIGIYDTGEESSIVEDATHERWRWMVMIYGLCDGASDEELQEQINLMVSSIKAIVNDTTFTSSVLRWRITELPTIYYSPSTLIGGCMVETEILYTTEKGSY